MFESNTDFDFEDNLQLNSAPRSVFKAPIKRKISSEPPDITKKSKNVVKRKFPGPAGILPDRKNFNFSIPENLHKNENDEIPCTQRSVSVFQDSPWIEMCREYGNFVENFNIKWIKLKASLNKLPDQKAPFLGAIIQNIECFDEKTSTVNVVLKDNTGEIQGTVIRTLYEQYSKDLIVGAVIVLRQFAVLTTSSSNNHLTITNNNLVRIFTKKIKEDESDIEVRVVKVNDVTIEETICNFEEIQNKGKFKFKKKQVTVNCTQEETGIWEDALEGLDADSFFEDF